MPMDPGRMSEPVAVEAMTRTPDDAGGYTEAWADVSGQATVWAEFAPLRGQEQIIAQQTEASATERVRMWADAVPGITAVNRIRRQRDDRIYEIMAPPTYIENNSVVELLVRSTE